MADNSSIALVPLLGGVVFLIGQLVFPIVSLGVVSLLHETDGYSNDFIDWFCLFQHSVLTASRLTRLLIALSRPLT